MDANETKSDVVVEKAEVEVEDAVRDGSRLMRYSLIFLFVAIGSYFTISAGFGLVAGIITVVAYFRQ